MMKNILWKCRCRCRKCMIVGVFDHWTQYILCLKTISNNVFHHRYLKEIIIKVSDTRNSFINHLMPLCHLKMSIFEMRILQMHLLRHGLVWLFHSFSFGIVAKDIRRTHFVHKMVIWCAVQQHERQEINVSCNYRNFHNISMLHSTRLGPTMPQR